MTSFTESEERQTLRREGEDSGYYKYVAISSRGGGHERSFWA